MFSRIYNELPMIRHTFDLLALLSLSKMGYNVFSGISLFSAHGFVEEIGFYVGAVFGSGWAVLRFIKLWRELYGDDEKPKRKSRRKTKEDEED